MLGVKQTCSGLLLMAILLAGCTQAVQVPGPEPEVTGIMLDLGQDEAAPGSRVPLRVIADFSDGSTSDVTSETSFTVKPAESAVVDSGVLVVSSQVRSGDTIEVVASYGEFTASSTVLTKYSLAETVALNENGLPVIINCTAIDVLVNKERNLPANYIPPDLVKPDVRFSFSGEHERQLMRAEAARALEELFAAAKAEGIELAAVSGYRSYETQKRIFNNNVANKGLEEASKFSARPGQSEHQTGLAMDVSAASVGYRLVQEFGETKEGQWLKEHAHKFGFIIRYPKGKEHITGYLYEPWHLRYVGRPLAQILVQSELTLEEFFIK